MEYTPEFIKSIQFIQNLKLKHAAEGSHKKCYTIPGNKVMLKDDSLIGKKLTTTNNINSQKQNINKLIYAGVQTPKIYETVAFDGALYQIQDKAQGSPLFVLNPEQVGFSSFGFMRDELSPKALKLFGDKIYTYNNNMLNNLKTAPQWQYDLYIDNLCTMVKGFKLNCLDMNCSNIFYDKNVGFTFIDIEFTKDSRINNTSDSNILEMAFIPFCYATSYNKLLQPGQLQTLKTNSLDCAEKLFIAAKNNNLKANTDLLKKSLSNMIGETQSLSLCNKFQHEKVYH